MTKLSIPLICECGFSTMDAKEAYDHAMTHHDSEMHIKNIGEMKDGRTDSKPLPDKR
jgi:hypothetical protein